MDRCGEWPCTGEPQRVEGAPVLRTVGGGTTFTYGLYLAGAAYCWGRGKSLDGIVPSDAIPRKVAGDLTFEQLSMQAIADATCGIATDTILYCWGWGGWALPWIASEEPVAFETDLEFASVTIAQNHMCALTAAGSAYCWGSNWSGQLGIGWYGSAGGNAVVATPQLVLGGHAFTQLVASAMFTCGLTALGDVYCWGSIVADLSSNVPQRVVAVPAFAELYAGSGHLCGLTAAGEAYCWGENYLGALGDGTREHNSAPVAVLGGHRFAELTAASGHTCGLTTDGRAYCWGGNAHGQIGRPGFEAPPGMGWW
ncbi:MAG: hypothetical protein H0U69_05335 [Trueperaceae bacterium]|nr:hypothetical protein [Trueperaceae bacterium]